MWVSNALAMIAQERERQIIQEGYTLTHDDEHTEGQLALLAAAYALSSRREIPDGGVAKEVAEQVDIYDWPFNPKNPIRDLTRAGALILAELERRLKAEEKKEMPEAGVQLPRWQSHKVVAADKIIKVWHSGTRWDLACGATIEVSQKLENRVPHGVDPFGGYYVRYEGFESWSPAEAFEKGYTRLP